MARPVKQTVDYFPHDTDASAGRTLTILEHKFGNDGYAFWFKLLELLGRTRGHYFAYNDDDSFEFLLAKTGIKDTEIAHKILATLSTMGAIDKELYEHKIIWSQNFVDGIADVYDRRKLPLPIKPDWRVLEDTNEVFNDNNPVSDNRSTQTKVKETKVNNIKVKDKKGTTTSPEKQEVEFSEFIEELRPQYLDVNFDNELQKFHLYWSEGGRKLRRPKLALMNWMDKAREFKKEGKHAVHRQKLYRRKKGGDEDDPDRYIKGKYGHMVNR